MLEPGGQNMASEKEQKEAAELKNRVRKGS